MQAEDTRSLPLSSSNTFRVGTYVPAQRNPFSSAFSRSLEIDKGLLACSKALRLKASQADAERKDGLHFCDLVINLARSGDVVTRRDLGPLHMAARTAPLRESAHDRLAMYRLSVPYKGSERYVDRLLFIEGRAYESLRELAQKRANSRPISPLALPRVGESDAVKICNGALRQVAAPITDIKQILKAAESVSIIRRTPVACYARKGQLVSHAPACETLAAVGHRVPNSVAVSCPSSEWGRRTCDDDVIQPCDSDFELDLSSFRRCFRHQSCRSAQERLMAWKPVLPASEIVRNFCLYKLSSHRKHSTTYRYGSLIMNRVVARMERQSVLDVALEDLESVYEQAILDDLDSEDVSQVTDMTRRAIAAFHLFLRRKCGVANLDDLRTVLLRRAYRPVDSIIVTVDQFEHALVHIRTCEDWEPLREGIIQFAIIAFYGGLRSSELYNLRLMDFRFGVGVDVIPYRNHSLKSCSSRRRIPLWHLMPAKESAVLRTYIEGLQNRFPPSTRWTDTILGRDGRPISEDTFRMRGLELFREALKMPEFRFHSLRHSAANLVLLKLAGCDRKRTELFFRDSPKTYAWIQDGSALREAIFFDPEERGCELLAVSSILGHAHPVTTVTNYIHLVELLP